ncbi:TPA: DUF6283 family protein [Pseudomonas aeruginosa]
MAGFVAGISTSRPCAFRDCEKILASCGSRRHAGTQPHTNSEETAVSSTDDFPRIAAPCPGCPWRVGKDATDIPHFSMAKAESLAKTSPCEKGYGPSFTDDMFACHQSKVGEEFACAGWLASVGHAHPRVRLALMQGRLPESALAPGKDWPELHSTFQEVIEKLRATAPESHS